METIIPTIRYFLCFHHLMFCRDEIAKRSIRITIKKNLSGHISVVQNNVTLAKSDNTATLQTKVMSKFQVHLYDPEGEKMAITKIKRARLAPYPLEFEEGTGLTKINHL